MTRRRRCTRLATTILFLGITLPLACGGGGGTPDEGQVLFAGAAGELAPHPRGRSSSFRVTASGDGRSDVSGFTSTVTANADDGTFVTRFVSATGAVAESTSRDTGDEIRVERFVNDPGGPDEDVVLPEPPVGVVRTPVVAGDAIESGFARTLELTIRIGESTLRRQLLFAGRARRVAMERTSVSVPAGTYDDAIRYAVTASGDTHVTLLGESVAIAVDVEGDEWFAPGSGGVKEEIDVSVRAGDEHATIHFTTEKE